VHRVRKIVTQNRRETFRNPKGILMKIPVIVIKQFCRAPDNYRRVEIARVGHALLFLWLWYVVMVTTSGMTGQDPACLSSKER
jgi:hypothetical protein